MIAKILTENNTVCNVYAAPRAATKAITVFDDLYQHGDYSAAALALGDTWLMMPQDDQLRVVNLVKEIMRKNEA